MNTPFHNTVIVSNFQPFIQVFLYVFCVFLFVGILDYQQFIIRDTHPTEHRYNGVSHTTSYKYRKGEDALTPTPNLFASSFTRSLHLFYATIGKCQFHSSQIVG